jgi:hypothetical protein
MHTGMAAMVHNAATLMRIHQQYLSNRAHQLCRWLRLRCRHAQQYKLPKINRYYISLIFNKYFFISNIYRIIKVSHESNIPWVAQG